jgi:hypothetical protein
MIDAVMVNLDDYHVIDAVPVDWALAYLVEHLPPQMQLVMATRGDPHLPLAGLRARGQLTEMRAADLRFTPAEAVFGRHGHRGGSLLRSAPSLTQKVPNRATLGGYDSTLTAHPASPSSHTPSRRPLRVPLRALRLGIPRELRYP